MGDIGYAHCFEEHSVTAIYNLLAYRVKETIGLKIVCIANAAHNCTLFIELGAQVIWLEHTRLLSGNSQVFDLWNSPEPRLVGGFCATSCDDAI